MNFNGRISVLLVFFLSFASLAQEQITDADAEQQAYQQWASELWSSVDMQKGDIEIADGAATLHVPDSFYYLNQEDAEKVLVQIWGNPADTTSAVLGMLFPGETTPFDGGSWGVTVEYVEEGYISDEDAAEIDYSEMLTQMKSDTQESSKARVEQGYEPIELIGWAAPPYYDKTSNKLHWAKEIRFGDNPINTLNYNIRVLGRKGMMVLNFISDMDQLDIINGNIDNVLAMAEFNQGSRYDDFNPDLDQVAAYGLGALVAGKLVAKTGLIAMALIFLKKFGIVLVIAIGAFFRKFFKGKAKQE